MVPTSNSFPIFFTISAFSSVLATMILTSLAFSPDFLIMLTMLVTLFKKITHSFETYSVPSTVTDGN